MIMGTKRKASGRSAANGESSGWKDREGELGPISSYEDVADSEDEFHINRDKIMLDEGPEAKRRRKLEEDSALLDASDEEVLGYDSDGEEEEEDVPEDDEVLEDEIDDEELGGYEKKEYYGADTIETEEQAKEIEEEARRLQQKNLQKMSAADFGFDEDEWLDAARDKAEKEGIVTETLVVKQLTPDMSLQERTEIMQTRYPEYELLANEVVRLQPIFIELREQVESEKIGKRSTKTPRSTAVTKYRALGAYLACVGMYFAVLTSPVRDSESTQLLDPAELRDHPIIDSIFKCRDMWQRAKKLTDIEVVENSEGGSDAEFIPEAEPVEETKRTKKQKALETSISQASILREKRIEQAEQELSSLPKMMPKPRKSTSKPQAVDPRDDDDNSDFGEEEHLSARAAADKAKKRKSLQFYTSQVAQKANKRTGAGRDAGGDIDLPHKERLRDRQERLNAEAAARGRKLDEYGRGADLGGDSGDEDAAAAKDVRDEEDEYYDMVAKLSRKKKQDKAEKYDAIRKAKEENGLLRVVEGEVEGDGKRAIGYTIEKNKGLAPKRKKDVRNPRVKKRMKFDAKKKKLSSMRAVYKGGEERGGYGGEKTGIKTGLVKSIKLS